MTRPDRLPDSRYYLPDNERHRLVLHFSRKCIDWCFAGVIDMTVDPRQSRNYPAMAFDGEDLLVLLETARNAAEEDVVDLPSRATRAVVAATGLRPTSVVVLPPGCLPRTSSGKLRRKEALRAFLADELAAPKEVTPTLLAGALARSSLEYARLRLVRKGERRD